MTPMERATREMLVHARRLLFFGQFLELRPLAWWERALVRLRLFELAVRMRLIQPRMRLRRTPFTDASKTIVFRRPKPLMEEAGDDGH